MNTGRSEVTDLILAVQRARRSGNEEMLKKFKELLRIRQHGGRIKEGAFLEVDRFLNSGEGIYEISTI